MSDEIDMLNRRLDKLAEAVDHKTDQLWGRVNLNTDANHENKRILERIDTTLSHLTDALHRIDNHIAPTNGLTFDKRLDRLEQDDSRRKWHLRAIWTLLTGAVVDWLARHFT